MKLLVTGGSGFLGRRTAAYFENLGWQVFAPGHSRLDITDRDGVREWFEAHRPDAMIHTAAVSDTGVCQQRPEWSEVINVTGTENLVQCCRDFGTKPLICSSDQVYFGSRAAEAHRETEALIPGNVYGGQKLRTEARCLEICPETVCLRLSWMYAPDRLPGEKGDFLSALKVSLEEKRAIIWPVHDRRGLTDVTYVVENLPAALKLPGGIWNFGSENHRSTYDTVKAVLQKLQLQEALLRLQPNEAAFSDGGRNLSMDLTKLKEAGISFPTTEEGLLQALKNGNGEILTRNGNNGR